MASIFPLFVPAIRDYIDVLNNAYDSVLSNNNLQQVLQQSVIYIFASIKFLIIYFFSFQWVQDLSYLPVVVPQLKLEILKQHFFLQTPQSNLFTFLEIPSYTNNKFFLGFANSFFLCLPLSVAHIISMRRLLIQGIPAGVFSSLGTICGQILLLICILFGGRFFVTPWFNFQVLNYFIGISIVLKIVYDMTHERSIRIIDSSNTSVLIRIFLLNFILAWTEQSCVFQYFGNLTFGAEPSIIEIFSSLSALQSVLAHIYYLIGIILGSVVFTSLFIFSTLKSSNLYVQFSSILYSRWVRRLNFSLMILIIAFTFTSIPFYSFDYLILSNLGFVSQDKSLTNSVFSSKKIYDFTDPILGSGYNIYADGKPGIDTDISRFSKGRYLMFDVNDSFEQLNYQGEYAWLTKDFRKTTVTRKLSSLRAFQGVSKFFKKNKKLSQRKAIPSQNEIFDTQDSETSEIDIDENPGNVFNLRNKKNDVINDSFENLINTSISNKFYINQQLNSAFLEKKFKQRYYTNPIYKLLLSADIDFFLSRQPRSFALSPKEESDLFQKRNILSNYYDSLRYYDKLPSVEDFQDFFNGSKSYADRVYNHQFNGTLKIVRRLFSINANLNDYTEFSDVENPISDSKVFDAGKQKPISDETSSLEKNKNYKKSVEKKFLAKKSNNTDSLVLKFDQPLYKRINSKNSQPLFDSNEIAREDQGGYAAWVQEFFHEEFNVEKKNNIVLDRDLVENSYEIPDNSSRQQSKENFSKPFIELTNPIPFYVGWDEQLRKLVITNRLSGNFFAGESMKFLNKNNNNNYYPLSKLIQKNKTINFTAWPISKDNLENIKPLRAASLEKKQASYNLLFESITEEQNNLKFKTLMPEYDENSILMEDYTNLTSVPSNILLNGQTPDEQKENQQMRDIIPYTRGGFVWPGHSDLKFKFKKLSSFKFKKLLSS
jgi:hypothetical protein